MTCQRNCWGGWHVRYTVRVDDTPDKLLEMKLFYFIYTKGPKPLLLNGMKHNPRLSHFLDFLFKKTRKLKIKYYKIQKYPWFTLTVERTYTEDPIVECTLTLASLPLTVSVLSLLQPQIPDLFLLQTQTLQCFFVILSFMCIKGTILLTEIVIRAKVLVYSNLL